MNKFLVIPLIGCFALVTFVAASHSARSGANVNSNEVSIPDPESGRKQLLSLPAARELVKKRLDETFNNRRTFSRAIVLPPQVMTVEFQTKFQQGFAIIGKSEDTVDEDVVPESGYFLGQVTIQQGKKNLTVPVAVDRSTGQIFVHNNSTWVMHSAWYPAT